MISEDDSLWNMFGNVPWGLEILAALNDTLRSHVSTNYLCIMGRNFSSYVLK